MHEDDPTSLDSLCFSSDCLEEIESLLTEPPSDRPKAPKVKRHRPGPEPRDDRLHVWNIVLGWDEATFRKMYHIPRCVFEDLVNRCIHQYPGPFPTGRENYELALRKGKNATPWGPIIIEIKILIFLRILAGGNHLDMYWYGVQFDSVRRIFRSMIRLFKKCYTNKEIFDFDYKSPQFQTHVLALDGPTG